MKLFVEYIVRGVLGTIFIFGAAVVSFGPIVYFIGNPSVINLLLGILWLGVIVGAIVYAVEQI